MKGYMYILSRRGAHEHDHSPEGGRAAVAGGVHDRQRDVVHEHSAQHDEHQTFLARERSV